MMSSKNWLAIAEWFAFALTFSGCVDQHKTSEHTLPGTVDTAPASQKLASGSREPDPHAGAASVAVNPAKLLPSAPAANTFTPVTPESTSTSLQANTLHTLLVPRPSLAPLTVAPEVLTHLTQVRVEWHGTLSGWGERLTFPVDGKPERLLDGQGGSMRLLTVPPTSLWVERRWDGGGVDVHHFESSALPEGWELYFVDNVTKIHARDPVLSGKWNGLALAKWPDGFVERFIEAWPIDVKAGIAFRPLTDELFPVVFVGNARRKPSLWAAFDSHCPIPHTLVEPTKGAPRVTSPPAPTQQPERHCLLMGSAVHVNKALMRHAGVKRSWELSTWMDPN